VDVGASALGARFRVDPARFDRGAHRGVVALVLKSLTPSPGGDAIEHGRCG